MPSVRPYPGPKPNSNAAKQKYLSNYDKMTVPRTTVADYMKKQVSAIKSAYSNSIKKMGPR